MEAIPPYFLDRLAKLRLQGDAISWSEVEHAAGAEAHGPMDLTTLVFANSPSLCPTMSVVMARGTYCLPLCTRKRMLFSGARAAYQLSEFNVSDCHEGPAYPTKCGRTVQERAVVVTGALFLRA